MSGSLKEWQRTAIRNNMEKYRKSLENYYIQGKQLFDIGGGQKAFSLISPPLGSPVARRRVRFIIKDMLDKNKTSGNALNGNLEKRTPHFITISVTYKCQCNCAHCSAYDYSEDARRNKSSLNLNELKDVIRQTLDLGTTGVIFVGGEPLLYEGIYDLIACVPRSKAVCSFFTNGEYLSEDVVCRLKKAGLYGLFVSLDYSDPRQHDSNRGRKGIFAKAIEGIKLCQKKKIVTGIATFATREKIQNGELDAMMELGRRLNVLEVFLFDIIATGKLQDDFGCMLHEGEVEAIRDFRQKYNSKLDYPRILHQTMFNSIAYPCVAEGCPAGVVHMHLRCNGDLSPCDFTPFSFGNIRQEPLKQIWERMVESEIYAKLSPRCRLADPGFWEKAHQLMQSLESHKNEDVTLKL